MCNPSVSKSLSAASRTFSSSDRQRHHKVPIERVLAPPSLVARYTCVAVLVGIVAVWGKYSFCGNENVPGRPDTPPMHSAAIPVSLTVLYLASLPLLRLFAQAFLSAHVDVKALLCESMILYNAGQVLLNGWMVYRILDALVWRGHPFLGGPIHLVDTGATYAVYVHYCDKYLEYLDTFFMVLRGKMDQVSFLHIYHHTSIALAWWIGLSLYPGGDIYFGALINSWIHVMMYSYYTLSLLKIRCPWKKYLTMAQLVQFVSVVVYSACSLWHLPAEVTTWKQYLGYGVQVFEMSSLFVLFMHFYRKAYSQKKESSTNGKQEASASDSLTTPDTMAEEQDSISSDSSTDEQ